MAFPSADMMMISAWHWLQANALPILIATYFIAMAAVILLALHVSSLSHLLRQLRQSVDRDTRRIDLLEISTADQTRAFFEAPPTPSAEAQPAQAPRPAEKPELDPAKLRSELESVLSELWHDADAPARDG